MKRRTFTRSLLFSAVPVLFVILFFSVHLQIQATPSDVSDNPQVSKLLEDIMIQSADLQRDSDELESFTHSNVSWESHATELESIKEHINRIGQTIQKLENLRDSASPWQQEAINRLIPVAQKLASNTTAAIQHLNQNRTRIQEPRYQEYLKENAEAASQLNGMIRDFVQYGKTRNTLETLERRLELPQ
jgi:DNA replication protein DnaD